MRVVPWGLTLVWMGLLAYGSLTRAFPLPVARAVAATGNALLHFLGYGILAVLLRLALGRGLAVAIGLAFAYGALLEGAQLAVPDRTASWADLGVNLAGALAGASLWCLIRRAVSRVRPRSG